MYYYRQINRETGAAAGYLSCSVQLQDDDPTLRLEEITEEEFNAAIAAN